MGFFGLTTEEAIILAQKYNRADNERNEQRIKAIDRQTEEIKRNNKEFLKSEQEKNSEISREARQLEPFITLEQFGSCYNETYSIRPSDIKFMNGKIEEREHIDYNDYALHRGYGKTYTKHPYTEIQLWDGRKLKVKESISDVQNKVNEVIEKMVNLRARILSETLQNQN